MAIKVSERRRRTDVVLPMKLKMVIKLYMNEEKHRSKAMKTVIGVDGIESVALGGEEKDQLEVLGSSFDAILLVQLLRKTVCRAHLISVSTSRWPNDRSQRIGNSSTNGEVREPWLRLPSLRVERLLKVFIGCYKPPTSEKNSKRLGDRSSKWEPAGNQDFSTGSGSVNPKLPEIGDPLDLDLETTNSVLNLCDKPATSGDNLESLGDQSNAYECTANPTSSTSGSIFLKLREYGDPLDPDLETINLCELNSRTDLVKTVSSTGYKQKLPCHNVKLNSQGEFEIPLNISDKGFLQWNHVLVGCFFDNDKKFDFHLRKLWAESSWKDDLLDVHSLGENGFFMFKFKNANVVDCILSEGPYFLGEKLINFKKWEPGLHLSKCVFSFFPIWVKFFNVPLELWTEEGLSFVASVIGKPLFLDEPTRLKSRLTFARVRVEVDASKEIPNSFKINLGYCEPYEIKVEVSWRPWSQRHDVSMAIGEASNSLPSGAEEKGKDVVEDSTFASTSIMFDVLDQLTSMEGPSGDNTEMILMPCPSSSTNLDVLATCAAIVENSRGQGKSKREDKLFSSNKANPSGLVEIEILGTNEEEIEGNLPRELVETLVKKEDEGLVLGECEL
ncbi:Heavy metal-associated isoprenylated plant protein 46 [Camellia lanceoleosa]|uniref:Heavy metal-associated isoprenylated plant protein 46 n=1 Tax=Camellia lanceoleosa TaxID=1840588 RepID=A0ACC0H6F4_9ERIC|nr:Heavy metal-associated isoprenylated plant protein 46 [Camellia lanceoleosa]